MPAIGTPVDKMPPLRQRWLNRKRVIVYCAALLICQLAFLAAWAVAHWVLHIRGVAPLGTDFQVYWSTSYISLHDGAIQASNPSLLLATEAKVFPGILSRSGYLPWVYPPTFQLLVYPLALLPYAASYSLFVCVGIACCLAACAPAVKAGALPWICVLAFPGIWIATLYGQNSLITLALAASALCLLERRPLLAGVCAGMLAIKPQLAALFPLMFICGRHFRAFGAMAVTGGLFCAVSGLFFGLPLWFKFFDVLSWFNTAVVQNGGGDIWNATPTAFGFARRLGASLPAAYALHAAVAAPAVLATSILWARRARFEVRSAALVITTLLIQPYLLYYDLAWLILPITYLCLDRAKHGAWTRVDCVIIAFAWLLPIPSFLAVLKPAIGQWGIVLLPLLLGVVLARGRIQSPVCDAAFNASDSLHRH